MQSSDIAASSAEPIPHPPAAQVSADAARSAGAALPTRKILLGEELPIFCEKCGYALHGLEQQICAQCSIRHFHCPECGHHQPINTLRPAAQKLLGRIRAFALGVMILFKLNFFGWLLVAWVSLGYEMSYRFRWEQVGPARGRYQFIPLEFEADTAMGFAIFALSFGMVGRMFLLRWRRGYLIGLILSALVCLALVGGAIWRQSTGTRYGLLRQQIPSPLTGDFSFYLLITASVLMLGASAVWGIWSALVYIFLPKRTGQALLDWQASQSTSAVSHLARE